MGLFNRWSRAALLAAALCLLTAPLARPEAQQRTPARSDSVRADTAHADTGRAARRGPPPDPAADSILQLLLKLPGFTATEYQGEAAVYQADEGVLRLLGSAEVSRAGDRLTADTIVYRDRTELVEAYGSPKAMGQAQELQGNVLFYDLGRRRATALGARTKVSEGATWLVRGDVTLEGTDRVYARHGSFTTCDLEIPHYHFESDQIFVWKDRILVARPARLYFGKVPVMVLPFVVQNLQRGRRSGLVVPRFSVNDIVRTSSGHTRELSDLGWYWAINDYLGAQITGGWRSETYTSLEGRLDFRNRERFLDGSGSFRQYWTQNGSSQFNLSARGSWKPDERTDLALDAQYATSSQFIRNISSDPRETTQELASNFRVNRRFDWGAVAAGAQRRQSIADGSTNGTLPSFSISPKTITFFRAPSEELARWYSNASLQLGLSGDRTFSEGRPRQQDENATRLQGGIQQLSIGNLSLSATGNLNQRLFLPGEMQGPNDQPIALPESNQDQATWQASIGYQQKLIGQTMLTPNVSLSQEIRRDSLTQGAYMGAPTRMNVGASLSTALFGFFPGIGPYSAIRHRLSPSMSYSYSPTVEQTEVQQRVFGAAGGRAQNIVSLTLNQTFEAKLREPRTPAASRNTAAADTAAADTAAADTAARDTARADTTRAIQRESVPTEPQKVTLLSLSTSSISYDFARAEEEGVGFVTDRISNTISSDYLQGLTIQMEHELFDRRNLNPSEPENRGKLGSFAPRLSSLSTAFELGPSSALFRWLGLGGAGGQDRPGTPTSDAVPGREPSDDPQAPGSGAATGNPQSTGGGPWRASLNYSFSRMPRMFSGGQPLDDRAIQTVAAQVGFSLTPNWAVSWTTDYSITDNEFGTHRLNFKRDLHRWQANFNFYQTPFGSSAFEFYVELIDNRDLKFDYRERNLGIDRGRRR